MSGRARKWEIGAALFPKSGSRVRERGAASPGSRAGSSLARSVLNRLAYNASSREAMK
jgi:hypothetical protein